MLIALAAALAIPAEYRGVWASSPTDCARIRVTAAGRTADLSGSDGLIRVEATGMDFFASRATLIEGVLSHGAFTFTARTEEEGEFGTARIVLRRRGRRLAVTLDGEALSYVRCARR